MIRKAFVGIGVSVTPGAGTALVNNNMISETPRGAVVGLDHARPVTPDLVRRGRAALCAGGDRDQRGATVAAYSALRRQRVTAYLASADSAPQPLPDPALPPDRSAPGARFAHDHAVGLRAESKSDAAARPAIAGAGCSRAKPIARHLAARQRRRLRPSQEMSMAELSREASRDRQIAPDFHRGLGFLDVLEKGALRCDSGASGRSRTVR